MAAVKRRETEISVKRIAGDSTKISFAMEWDMKKIPRAREQRIWKGIGMMLAAVLNKAEAKEFIAKLNAAKENAADARA